MVLNEDAFLERYNKLNDAQKEAVNEIEGPVMVIAGPGTGKTEVLAMRIANMLRSEAQVQPQDILCLTYTEEATNSMRRRLVQIAGVAAHKVNIFTFHAFCNNIIQSNSEYFSLRTLQPITDLERTELMYAILEALPPGHPLRRLSGDIYYDSGKLDKLFGLMKREHLSSAYISEAIDEYLLSLPDKEKFIYKRNGANFKKGDLKQALIDEEKKKMETTRAAAGLFAVYEEKMREAGRYDFDDMILWVLEGFRNHEWMLQSYQERYQYILVDEFQDTNGAQNELINVLTSYWESPNIFVVGDDDQSIYEFQGARIKNITDFYTKFQESIRIVVLTNNYRSSQLILNKALATITNNQQRLIKQLEHLGLDKNIVAAAERFTDTANNVHPQVKVYNNILQEETDLVLQIEALRAKGIALKDVAIIYSQHKQADNIIAILERKGIPFNVKRSVNVLEQPLTMQILNILQYLNEEKAKPFSAEDKLFELMHAPYFEIAPIDLAQLALYLQTVKKGTGPTKWRMLVANHLLLETIDLSTVPAIRRLSNNLENWEREQTSLPLPLLIEKIVYESGIVNYLLKTADHVWAIQSLNTFFEFVKDACGRNNKMRSSELLLMVERMNDRGIKLPMQRTVQTDDGLYFYTAHSAKGNEFEHVFLIGCTKNFWENNRGGGSEYAMPDTITRTDEGVDKEYKTEVARRLFYVALTRARKYLHISFSLNDNAGKALENSVFVDEVSKPEERVRHSVTSTELINNMAWAISPVPEPRIKTANAVWIEQVLKQFTMSYTSLSKFLKCRLAFYYETILRVPYQKSDALAFGSAVHMALERFFLDMKAANGEFPSLEQLLQVFKNAMMRESGSFTAVQYERRMEQGNTILSAYYGHYIGTLHKNVEIEFKVPRFNLEGVPVTAKIDKIEIYPEGVKVIDYKTGDPDKSMTAMIAPPNDKDPNGGDYWRQMVFYKLLLERYEDRARKVILGMFDYLQPNSRGEYKQMVVPVFAQDEEVVLRQLKDSYTSIMNHEFDTGCGDDDCHWCNFVKRYNIVRPAETDIVEINDI